MFGGVSKTGYLSKPKVHDGEPVSENKLAGRGDGQARRDSLPYREIWGNISFLAAAWPNAPKSIGNISFLAAAPAMVTARPRETPGLVYREIK